MKLLIPEILTLVEKAPTKEARKKILLDNDSPQLRQILKFTFHPRIKFGITTLPKYRPEPNPVGLNPNSLYMEARERENGSCPLHVFYADNVARVGMPRLVQILTQILESVAPMEAELLGHVFNKKLPYKRVTAALVQETFPDLLKS